VLTGAGASAVMALSRPPPAALAGWGGQESVSGAAALLADRAQQVRTWRVGPLQIRLDDLHTTLSWDTGDERRRPPAGATAGATVSGAAPAEPVLAQPRVPTERRFATTELGQELESAYLDYVRVLGEALLTLDPAPLSQVLAGEALQEVTEEIQARKAAEFPAQLNLTAYWLAFYHHRDGAPAILALYVDQTAPVDPRTGRATRPQDSLPLLRESYVMQRTDEGWRVVRRTRERLGTVAAPFAPEGDVLGPADPALDAARAELRQVLDEAWLTNNGVRLPEVLDEPVVANLNRSLDANWESGYAWLASREHLFTAYLPNPDGSVRVDEVYFNAGTWLDTMTYEQLPDQPPPALWGETYTLREIDGTWKAVDGWWTRDFGQAIR
jgi:hypothetical protein